MILYGYIGSLIGFIYRGSLGLYAQVCSMDFDRVTGFSLDALTGETYICLGNDAYSSPHRTPRHCSCSHL